MPWQTSREKIGQNRTWVGGRILAGAYFLLIGIYLLAAFLVLKVVYALIDGLYALITDRPLNWGRTWSKALYKHQLLIAKYSLGDTSWPGMLPRRAHGER